MAVIGTGASAIQFVPEIAKVAGHVDVFQRTAPYVLPKADRAVRRHRAGALRPAAGDAQGSTGCAIFLAASCSPAASSWRRSCSPAPMQMWRRHSTRRSPTRSCAAKCVPDYVVGCKRILFSNDWYPALAGRTSSWSPTRSREIVPDGVVTADGTAPHRGVDVIIYGTGSAPPGSSRRWRSSGRDGAELQRPWADGAAGLPGRRRPGFPNFFMLYGPNTNLGGNSIIYMLEARSATSLRRARRRCAAPRPRHHRGARRRGRTSSTAGSQSGSRTTAWVTGCHSWYTTEGRNTNNWPALTFRYRYRVRRFDLAAYRVMPSQPAATASAA